MKRRTCLKAILAVAGGAVIPAVANAEAGEGRPIQLHADLAVDPVKEEEMLRFFAEKFRPAAAQQPGYLDLRMLKLKSTLRGVCSAGSKLSACLNLRQRGAAAEMDCN